MQEVESVNNLAFSNTKIKRLKITLEEFWRQKSGLNYNLDFLAQKFKKINLMFN